MTVNVLKKQIYYENIRFRTGSFIASRKISFGVKKNAIKRAATGNNCKLAEYSLDFNWIGECKRLGELRT